MEKMNSNCCVQSLEIAISGISSTRLSSGNVQDSNTGHLGTKPSTILILVAWWDPRSSSFAHTQTHIYVYSLHGLCVRVHDLARDGRTEFLAPRTFQGNGVLGDIVDESPTGTALDANGREGWILVLVVVGRRCGRGWPPRGIGRRHASRFRRPSRGWKVSVSPKPDRSRQRQAAAAQPWLWQNGQNWLRIRFFRRPSRRRGRSWFRLGNGPTGRLCGRIGGRCALRTGFKTI